MRSKSGLKRFFVTNLLILAVIAAVGILAFGEGIPDAIARAADAPVFIGINEKGGVALEIGLCGGADFDLLSDVLNGEEVRPSIFFCPHVYKNDRGAVLKAEQSGFHTGLYICGIHDYNYGDKDMTMALMAYFPDNNESIGLSGARRVCWTFDANRALHSNEENFAKKIYDKSIIFYRYGNDSGELKKLIQIIKQSGYNITDVRSILQ